MVSIVRTKYEMAFRIHHLTETHGLFAPNASCVEGKDVYKRQVYPRVAVCIHSPFKTGGTLMKKILFILICHLLMIATAKAEQPLSSADSQLRDSVFRVSSSMPEDSLRVKFMRKMLQQNIGKDWAKVFLDSAIAWSTRSNYVQGCLLYTSTFRFLPGQLIGGSGLYAPCRVQRLESSGCFTFRA